MERDNSIISRLNLFHRRELSKYGNLQQPVKVKQPVTEKHVVNDIVPSPKVIPTPALTTNTVRTNLEKTVQGDDDGWRVVSRRKSRRQILGHLFL